MRTFPKSSMGGDFGKASFLFLNVDIINVLQDSLRSWHHVRPRGEIGRGSDSNKVVSRTKEFLDADHDWRNTFIGKAAPSGFTGTPNFAKKQTEEDDVQTPSKVLADLQKILSQGSTDKPSKCPSRASKTVRLLR